MYQTNSDKRSLRSALLLGAASAAIVSLSAPVMAQEENVETVVVTGSRIPQTGLYSSSPVTSVGQQEMKFEGTTNVENLLNALPQTFTDQSSYMANGSSGTATVDLRGLGSQRTLVLVDGKRLMPGDPRVPVADLNDIPAALVDHVEVLTGGASAVYGSDALAGVVNFIMRKDFEGVELDGTYTVYQNDNNATRFDALNQAAGNGTAPNNWWGGQTEDATLLLGANSANGKGNVTAYLNYRNTSAVLESQLDYSRCSMLGDRTGPNKFHCGGSSNYNRWISYDDLYAQIATGGPYNYDFFENGTGAKGSGTFDPFTGATNELFNYGALNFFQRPDTRYAGGFFGHYEVSPALDVYSSFMFKDDHTLAQIAPSGLFLGTGLVSGARVAVNCANPLMTEQERQTVCTQNAQALFGNPCDPIGDTGNCNITPGQSTFIIGRRDIEGGNRVDDLRHTSYRMVVGAKGDLGSGWSYDVYGQYGLSLFTETYDNEFSVKRVQNALQVDPATGQCFAAEPNSLGIIDDPQCVPLNIFDGIGSISKESLGYVQAQGFQEGFTQEQVISGSLTGDLGQWGLTSPWAKTGVGIALGAEYRDEELNLKTSRDFQINDLYGQGGATLPVPTAGFHVTEGFGEIRVPVVENMPYMEQILFTAGYRYSSYSTAGSVDSYKFTGEWQPIDDFRIRASYQRAVRAPNVLELFIPDNKVLFAAAGPDPCSVGGNPNCADVNGGHPVIDCPASQCNQLTGGNANLKPETSDTRSVGLVFTPTFIDGFTATVDYFNIRVSGFIGTVDPNETVAECYGPNATAETKAFFCPLVHRSPGGTLFGPGFVSALNQNTGALQTKGFDFEANYQKDLADWGFEGAGSLSANFIGTYLNNLKTTPLPATSSPGVLLAPTFNCAGLFSGICGTPNPRWRHKLRVTWSTPWDFDLSVQWRHTSGLLQNRKRDSAGNLLPQLNTVPSFDWFDLAGNWTIREGVQVHAGVNNIFDKEPPVLNTTLAAAPIGNGNTFPGVYDAFGRTIFVGATIKY